DKVVLSPTFRLGVSYASGDDGQGADKYAQFDPLLPDVHAFHGGMDIFAWSNIVDPNVRVTVVPWNDTTFSVEYRYAIMAKARGEWLNGSLGLVGRAASDNTSTELGHEIDAAFTWLPWTPLSLVFGYSAFILGDGAKAVLAASQRGELDATTGKFAPASLSHF